jgi:predicted 3-demethylubiquinone-9 3-methyltransferase (glyoxalase superfamily)
MARVATCLMFVGDQCGKAEEAMALYTSLFADSRILDVDRYGSAEPGTGVKQARFLLAGTEYRAMDSDGPHQFTFTPATSLFAECADEAELDAAYAALADGGSVLMPLQAYPFSPRFAWLADRYGVSWQLFLAAGYTR